MMKRRDFITNVCKSIAVAAVVPTALSIIDSPGIGGETITVPLKEKYYLDYEAFKAQAKWMEEQERKLWNYILYGENDSHTI